MHYYSSGLAKHQIGLMEKETEGSSERVLCVRVCVQAQWNTYHLSILGVFVSVGRSSDVIPHLTGSHCKNNTLSQSGGEKEIYIYK